MSIKNQHAELRAVITFDGTHALLGQATVRGSDIYCSWSSVEWGGGKRYESFRVSYYESGASRLHFGPTITERGPLPSIPPTALTGALKLSSGSKTLEDFDYVYRPRPDSDRRRTLFITPEDVRRGMGLEAWALEPGNRDAVEVALHEPVRPNIRLDPVGYVIADWVIPHVALIVKTVPPDVWPDMEKSFADSPRDPNRRTPFILGVSAVVSGSGLYTSSGLALPPFEAAKRT